MSLKTRINAGSLKQQVQPVKPGTGLNGVNQWDGVYVNATTNPYQVQIIEKSGANEYWASHFDSTVTHIVVIRYDENTRTLNSSMAFKYVNDGKTRILKIGPKMEMDRQYYAIKCTESQAA